MCNTQKPLFAGVIPDQSIDLILDYAIPQEFQNAIEIGSRVVIPIKNTKANGTVWLLKETSAVQEIKSIQDVAIESSIFTKDLIQLAEWLSYYYATPLHRVLQVILPKHIKAHEKERMEPVVTSLISKEALLSLKTKLQEHYPSQSTILQVLLNRGDKVSVSSLLKESKTSNSPLKTLIKKGVLCLQQSAKETKDLFEAEYFLSSNKKLSKEQQEAFDKINKSLEENQFASHLLFGVTGSGKTEVYLQAIQQALLQDKGIIFLVPEIALASQTIERLKGRFEEKIAVLHHRLSDGEKKESWHQIYTRKARIVVGARSAIFCPIPKLGLIIIDEEQENAYKQTGNAPCYHARDVAIMRAKFAQAVVVLGSATPSLESYQNALNKKFILSTLNQRPEGTTLPIVHVVDMKIEAQKQKKFPMFSDPLLSSIKKRLLIGEQSLLLLNRRGYHTSQVCLTCSYAAKCPHCESLLTFHLEGNCLSCHLCGYQIPPHRTCPSCQGPAPMKFKGFGTELVEKTLLSVFPECRTLRMDADTTTRKGSHEMLFKKFRSGKADVLIGTQMIAKGLHFPLVTLVGILHADITLNIPDFRASESLFQLLTQAAGRSGRSDLPGEVFIQTFLPEQSTIALAAKQDYLTFFQ